jgi:hypothetical protein
LNKLIQSIQISLKLMDFAESFKRDLFQINAENFETNVFSLFEYQYSNNPIYQQYSNYLKKTPKNVQSLKDIPFLPIEFWKTHTIKTNDWKEETYFLSSGTTQLARSKNLIRSVSFSQAVSEEIFQKRFGSLKDYEIIALLPSYQENPYSSLISMVDHFISLARTGSDYYQVKDYNIIKSKLENEPHKKLLLGVSYALLDLTFKTPIHAKNTIIMETGGMKGRKKEMVRTELHEHLRKAFNIEQIQSEYGMSELTSQAYTTENGDFSTPEWMQVYVRDTNDPFQQLPENKNGGINIIDLANIDTCAFIETKDLGKIKFDETFEVLGRFDNTDVRGCNLLLA